jgi:hypothetical protein
MFIQKSFRKAEKEKPSLLMRIKKAYKSAMLCNYFLGAEVLAAGFG